MSARLTGCAVTVPPDLAEAAPDALLVVGERGAITYLNAAAEALFGYRREWLLGRHYGALLAGRFQGHSEGIREAFATDPRPRQVGAALDLSICGGRRARLCRPPMFTP